MSEILSHIDAGVMTLTFNRVDKKNSLTISFSPATTKRELEISCRIACRKRPNFSAIGIDAHPAFNLTTASRGEASIVSYERTSGKGK